MIAHRGFSSHYPENTLLAFKKAIELGVDGIDADLRLSRDEKVIIFHDPNLKRITGLDKSPESLSLAELQALTIRDRQHIPSLEELLQLTASQTTLILEIKYNPSTYKRLCEIIQESIKDKLDWVEVSSFEDKVLEYIHTINPEIRLHKIIDKASTLKDTEFEKRYDYVSYFDIDISLKKIVLEAGLLQRHKVIFWTVDEEDISKEREAGLYGIMKNNPSV